MVAPKILKAIIKLSGRDFLIKENDTLSTFNLNKEVGEKITIPVCVCFDDNNQLINNKYEVQAVVVKNFKEKKVHSFKKVNRTRFNRLRGSRAHCTEIKIEKILAGGK